MKYQGPRPERFMQRWYLVRSSKRCRRHICIGLDVFFLSEARASEFGMVSTSTATPIFQRELCPFHEALTSNRQTISLHLPFAENMNYKKPTLIFLSSLSAPEENTDISQQNSLHLLSVFPCPAAAYPPSTPPLVCLVKLWFWKLVGTLEMRTSELLRCELAN
jgi:hypothetical protein